MFKYRNKYFKLSSSFFTIITLIIIISYSILNIRPWKNAEQKDPLINHDIVSYYSYLPAYFIHNDIRLNFIENDTIYDTQFWPETAPNGSKVIKTTMGMSILYSPFFFISHTYAKFSNKYDANGFSKPYEFFLTLSSLFYLIIGLYYLRKILL